MDRFEKALDYVKECIFRGSVATDGTMSDVGAYINDSANCFAESYDDYMRIWEYLHSEMKKGNFYK